MLIYQIETSLICNLKYPECALGGGLIDRNRGVLSFDNFKIIADQIQKYAKYIYLNNWGEPMLNEEIIEIIHYASKFARTNISTNALSLTEQKSKELINSGLSDLTVSIDGATQTTYEKYRIGGDLEKALYYLKVLHELNVKSGNKVNITPQFVVFKHNQHEIKEFSNICKAIGLNPFYKIPYIRKNSTKYSYPDIPELLPPFFTDEKQCRKAMSSCQMARYWINILLDGTVVPCCMDYEGVISFGNIYESGLMNILNSQKYLNFRKSVIECQAPRFCLDNCYFYILVKDLPVTKWVKV